MNPNDGGPSSPEQQRQNAAKIARQRVLAAYSSTVENLRKIPADQPVVDNTDRPYPTSSDVSTNAPSSTEPSTFTQNPTSDFSHDNPIEMHTTNSHDFPAQSASERSSYKDSPINHNATSEEWKKYHSAWQDYYKQYYNDYYSKAAQTYLATEKMKNERAASGKKRKIRNLRRALPAIIIALIILIGLFLQYNRLIFAPIMAYIVPDDNVNTHITAVDPNINQTVSADPRLIIPKLNIDVPVAFNIPPDDVMEAMNHGVAQFSIDGANALPGQVGNLVISGHSAGDIYSDNPYKFIFSGLERLQPGDLIYINYESTRYTYQVTGDKTVEPTDVGALIYPTDKPILTLITCTPLGTSRYRLLVSADQISPGYDSNNIATENPVTPDPSATDSAMPANSPSFFEGIWNGLFGE